MDLRQLIDHIFLSHAGNVGDFLESIKSAISRFDVDSSVDRLLFINNYGHLIGLPSRPGGSSTATTGVPTNGIAGFAPGALFINYKGGPGTALYSNVGTNLSAQWVDLDLDANLATLAGTTTITPAKNANRTNLLSLVGGFTTTLPAATGTGNIYKFTIGVVSTTGYIINTAGTDVFNGSILLYIAGGASNAAANLEAFSSTANKTLTLNGTTTGGVAIGDSIILTDIQTGVWSVSGNLVGSGTLATPFSN